MHRPLLTGLIAMFAFAGLSTTVGAATPDDAPTVKSIEPKNGAHDVDPGLDRITITFSEPMLDQSFSVTGGGPHFPEVKSFRFIKNCTVFVMEVKLKPDWNYTFGINGPNHKNFRSRKGVPVEPVLVTFRTKAEKSKRTRTKRDVIEPLRSLGKLEFTLEDAFGLTVDHTDYKGIPVFLVSGAAW